MLKNPEEDNNNDENSEVDPIYATDDKTAEDFYKWFSEEVLEEEDENYKY